ncbi:MAG TPA: ATP-binding protein [Limnobacter sp.]|nr:ATP-binding protein [Limnobacter sp.]
MKLAVLFRFVLFATLMGLASNVVMGKRAHELQAAQARLLNDRLASINQLRLIQSEFDALQTLVAAYVVSKNSLHLVNYYELLDTHAGQRKYAEPVDNVYWSNLIAGHVKPVPLVPAQAQTLEERLALPERIAPEVQPKLNLPVQRVMALSKQLREREQVIFALTQGLYDPDLATFVSEAPVRDDLAIQMLFSEEHLGLSNAIRAEIQGRIGLVERGYQQALAQQTQIINNTAQVDFYVGLLITALVLLGLAIIQRYAVQPLRELNFISKQIAQGNYNVSIPRAKFITEIVNLIRGFALMIGAFRRELEQGEAARAAQMAALEAKVGREKAEAQVQARSMLLANMSHEIRTPMNAILGMTALTLKSDIPERERSHLLKVQDAARSLLRLLNDILDFSKAESGMVEFEHIPFTLDEVLANSFLAVQSQAASRKLLLLNHMAEGYTALLGQRLVGDPSRLRQVLTNLLSNAVKFTEVGAVRVYSSLQTCSDVGLNLRIEVHDTGTGLSKSQMGRIFEKFAQADNSINRRYGGTGLGLSIAKELVTLMGGQIGVDSTPGQGSCFWFEVPVGYDNDVLSKAMPLVGEHALLLHRPGVEAQASASVLRGLGLTTEVVHTLDAFLSKLQTQPHHWVVMQSDLFDDTHALPDALLSALQESDARLLVLDRDLMSADSPLLRKLPEGLLHRLGHIAHPVLMQDLLVKPATTAETQGDATLNTEVHTHLHGKRALVLEDHPVNQVLIRALLESVGMQVTMHPHGMAAKTMLDDDTCPDFDLCITDLEMPVMDGYAFTEWLRDQTRWMDLPVIGLTGHAFPETRARCLDVGMDDFITKPVEPPQLYRTLLDALGVHASAQAQVPSTVRTDGLVKLPSLFLTHCADLPRTLERCLAANDRDAFAREIHSMVSLLAIMNEQTLHQQFRAFEQALKRGELRCETVLAEVEHLWPDLVQRYHLWGDTSPYR